MKIFVKYKFTFCGLLLTLAAFPVFGQQTQNRRINERPFQDFALQVKKEISEENVNPTMPFSVELKGELTEAGNLDFKVSKFVRSDGDARTISVAKSFIEAVSESGLLLYLKDLGVKTMSFTFAQDESDLYVLIVAEKLSVEKIMPLTQRIDKLTTDSLIKGTTVNKEIFILNVNFNRQDDKNFSVKFAYDKNVIQEIIKQRLKETNK